MRVTRSKMYSLLGHYVKAVFLDGKEIEGVLGYTSEFCEKQGWRKPDYFTIGCWDIKPSHLKSIKELEHEHID